MIPVSGNPHTFGGPKNNFVKASHYPQSGHLFVGQPARGTRKNFPPVNWQQEIKDYLWKFYHNGGNPTTSIVNKLTMLSIT